MVFVVWSLRVHLIEKRDECLHGISSAFVTLQVPRLTKMGPGLRRGDEDGPRPTPGRRRWAPAYAGETKAKMDSRLRGNDDEPLTVPCTL
jgi:hypothetical protein